MVQFVSPRTLGEAIGVSESSVKRWANEGRISVERTAGGHRRIALDEAVRFVRDNDFGLRRPELLGFAGRAGTAMDDLTTPRVRELYALLRAGRRNDAVALILAPFLDGQSPATVFDEWIAPAMAKIGELWTCESDGVLREHRATDICFQAVMEIKLALPEPPNNAPRAVGAGLANDPYLLGSLMAATVLQQAGWRASNLGPDTPLEVLAQAVEAEEAQLCWLSVSSRSAARRINGQVQGFADRLGTQGVSLVLGGRCRQELGRLSGPTVIVAEKMIELERFSRGYLAARPSA